MNEDNEMPEDADKRYYFLYGVKHGDAELYQCNQAHVTNKLSTALRDMKIKSLESLGHNTRAFYGTHALPRSSYYYLSESRVHRYFYTIKLKAGRPKGYDVHDLTNYTVSLFDYSRIVKEGVHAYSHVEVHLLKAQVENLGVSIDGLSREITRRQHDLTAAGSNHLLANGIMVDISNLKGIRAREIKRQADEAKYTMRVCFTHALVDGMGRITGSDDPSLLPYGDHLEGGYHRLADGYAEVLAEEVDTLNIPYGGPNGKLAVMDKLVSLIEADAVLEDTAYNNNGRRVATTDNNRFIWRGDKIVKDYSTATSGPADPKRDAVLKETLANPIVKAAHLAVTPTDV